MVGPEAKLANAAAIEQYAHAMMAKGLRSRAHWAFSEALRLRHVAEQTKQPSMSRAA